MDRYWIRFPQLVDFELHPQSQQITAYRHKETPDNTVSHLLLDQVIPRLFSHLGKIIIHASCIEIQNSIVAFCGESGWGKSTLAAYFYQHGYSLITDDCLLLDTKGSTMTGFPNYQGLRLLDSSLSLLPEPLEITSSVCHYASKSRISIQENNSMGAIPISTIFILNRPLQKSFDPAISIKHISRATALIELLKHCFPLDITDTKKTAQQFNALGQVLNNSQTQFYRLQYPRTAKSLPNVLKSILKATMPYNINKKP